MTRAMVSQVKVYSYYPKGQYIHYLKMLTDIIKYLIGGC